MTATRRSVLRLGLASVGLALATPATAAFAGPAARPQTRPCVDDRWVTLDGTYNVRDLGGLTAGDHTVRSGLVYRSATLSSLTDAGVSQLGALGVACVLDSRGAQERLDNGEDRLPAGVELVHAEIPNGTFTPTPNLPAPDPAVLSMFRAFVTDPQGRAGTAAVLSHAAAGDLPLVAHDSSGTYRTGWVSAVLLTALGVPSSQILDDFALSDVALGATFTFPQYLQAGLDQARTSYGSAHGFLVDGLGLGSSTLAALRRRLLS